MKKYSFIILLIIIALGSMIMFNSCGTEPTFDQTLLIGKWRRTSTVNAQKYEYYRYAVGGNGATWDEGDDVSEGEAQPFTWTLSGSALTLAHKGEMGQLVPKTYTLTTLTATNLSYKDAYGTIFAFYKAN